MNVIKLLLLKQIQKKTAIIINDIKNNNEKNLEMRTPSVFLNCFI